MRLLIRRGTQPFTPRRQRLFAPNRLSALKCPYACINEFKEVVTKLIRQCADSQQNLDIVTLSRGVKAWWDENAKSIRPAERPVAHGYDFSFLRDRICNVNRKGILMLGGRGTRLGELTQNANKHLLAVYDRPVFYYSLASMMLTGVREIAIVTTPHDAPIFERHLGDGSKLGLKLSYEVQEKPDGIASGLRLCSDKFQGSDVVFGLGDSIYSGAELEKDLISASLSDAPAGVFGAEVHNPERFGVFEFDADGRAVGFELRPAEPKSKIVLTGLLFFNSEVFNIANNLQPSPRGEYELDDVVSTYLDRGGLEVRRFNRQVRWTDMGHVDSLYDVSRKIVSGYRENMRLFDPRYIAQQLGYIKR